MSGDWRDEYYTQIDDCETDARSALLSAWECDFLKSLREQLDAKRTPSAKQLSTLDDIWNKATSKG